MIYLNSNKLRCNLNYDKSSLNAILNYDKIPSKSLHSKMNKF